MPPRKPAASTPAADERRLYILRTATELFSRHGFHQTGMRQLCDTLGMSPGALYRYFPGKEEIIAGLVALDRENVQTWMSNLPREDGLTACLEYMTRQALDDLSYQKGMLSIWLEISAEATRNPAISRLLTEHYRYVEELLAELISDAQARGDIRPQADPAVTARLLMAMHEGMTARSAVDPEFSLRDTAESWLIFVADALGARRPSRERRKEKLPLPPLSPSPPSSEAAVPLPNPFCITDLPISRPSRS